MIIDHVDNLELQDEEAEQYHNELGSLNRLSIGLHYLNYQVQKIEAEARDRLNAKDKVVHSYGNDPRLAGIPQDLVACAFDWYSVTACTFVRLVDWLVNGGNTAGATEYLRRVLPEVSVWRNKVGAHLAQTSPWPEDTPADLAKSVMFPIGFADDAFYADPFTVNIRSGDQTSSSRKDMRWSLTHTHRQLSSRYWPNQ